MIQLKGTESSGVRGCLFGEKSNGLLGEVGFKLGLSASCWEDQGHMVFQNTEEQVLSSVSCRDEGSQHGGPPCGTGQGGKVGSRPQLGFYFKQDGSYLAKLYGYPLLMEAPSLPPIKLPLPQVCQRLCGT